MHKNRLEAIPGKIRSTRVTTTTTTMTTTTTTSTTVAGRFECTILRIAPSRDNAAAHGDTLSCTQTHTRTRSHTNTLALPLPHTHLLHLMPSNNPHALAADSRRHYQTCSTQKMWISETILKRQQTCSRRLWTKSPILWFAFADNIILRMILVFLR